MEVWPHDTRFTCYLCDSNPAVESEGMVAGLGDNGAGARTNWYDHDLGVAGLDGAVSSSCIAVRGALLDFYIAQGRESYLRVERCCVAYKDYVQRHCDRIGLHATQRSKNITSTKRCGATSALRVFLHIAASMTTRNSS